VAGASEQVFVARQPIFSPTQRVAGYELLFRAHASSTTATFDDGTRATGDLLQHSLLAIGLDALTGGKSGFVNFPRPALLQETTAALPKQVVIEVLEDVGADDEVVAACEQLRGQGFRIALDDYCFEPWRDPLLSVASVVKVDLERVDLGSPLVRAQLQDLRRCGVQTLAEKVETHAQFEQSRALGFELFQGYFWGRPEVVAGRRLPPSARAYFKLVAALNSDRCNLERAKEIVKSDPALSQALLRYVNSGLFRWVSRVQSVHRAMAILGHEEMRRWAAMLALITAFDGLSPELVAHAVTRGRLCELLAPHIAAEARATDLFFAGLFSLADRMMGVPIEEALQAVPLDALSRDAILYPDSPFGALLGCAVAYQEGEWDRYIVLAETCGLPTHVGAEQYIEAVAWTDGLLGHGSASDEHAAQNDAAVS
jgi:EAL and modified HD-GYP domain-containing signal transduction protein